MIEACHFKEFTHALVSLHSTSDTPAIGNMFVLGRPNPKILLAWLCLKLVGDAFPHPNCHYN